MTWTDDKLDAARTIVTLMYERRMIRTFFRDKPDGWTLISGLYSPLYIQLRPLASYPEVFDKVCRAMARMIAEEAPEITRIVGIAMAGVPVAAGIALVAGMPAGFTRKLEGVRSVEALRAAIASYGEHALIEGELGPGDRIALVDDLVTRFDSKLIALEQVRHEIARRDLIGVECRTVAVVLDREQGGAESAREADVKLLSLIPFKTVGLPLLKGTLHPAEWDAISRYLDDPAQFQVSEVRADLVRLAQSQ
ncbi:MAG: hypothetical protein LDL33_01455 [Desulfomonile sp.]|nr:hypothetical protein [Desulfomonile sp.]